MSKFSKISNNKTKELTTPKSTPLTAEEIADFRNELEKGKYQQLNWQRLFPADDKGSSHIKGLYTDYSNEDVEILLPNNPNERSARYKLAHGEFQDLTKKELEKLKDILEEKRIEKQLLEKLEKLQKNSAEFRTFPTNNTYLDCVAKSQNGKIIISEKHGNVLSNLPSQAKIKIMKDCLIDLQKEEKNPLPTVTNPSLAAPLVENNLAVISRL